MSKNKISLTSAKKKLAVVWSVGAGFLFILIFIQTLSGAFYIEVDNNSYISIAKNVWSWFFPTIFPTLSLIIGVMVSDSITKRKLANVNRFLFKLTFYLSIFYLLIIVLTLLAAFAFFVDKSPVEIIEQSSLWLGPVQGLVTASLGAFFVSRENPV